MNAREQALKLISKLSDEQLAILTVVATVLIEKGPAGLMELPDELGLKVSIDHKIEKFNKHGELFEVIEGSDDKSSVVTYRKEGLAPKESYANTLKLASEG